MKNNYKILFILLAFFFSFTKNFAQTPLTATIVVTQPLTCTSSATITIVASGGTAFYLYSFDNLNFSGINAYIMGQPGTYTFHVKDSNNEIFIGTYTLVGPSPIYCSATSSGNNISVFAQAGSPPYTYSFLQDGVPIIAPTSGSFMSNLVTGVYTYIVQDTFGCSCSGTVFVGPNLNLSATSAYEDFNNDGFTNVGDVVNYVFTVTNYNSNETITSIDVTSPNCTISGATIPSLAPNTSDSTNFTGIHTITQSEINQGFVVINAEASGTIAGNPTSSQISNNISLTISDGIKLIAFVDDNGNNIQDTGEATYTQGNFTYQLNGGSAINTWGNTTSGYLIYENNVANVFNLSFTNNNILAFNLVTANYSNVSVAAGSGITTYYFPLTANIYTDAAISLNNINAPPRPGFTYSNRVFYQNTGSLNIPLGTVTFTKDSQLTILSTNPATTTTATGFTYDFTNLAPNTDGFIDVLMQVPTIPTVSLGNIVNNSASIAVTSDAVSSNNNASLSQTIVGSYDPNDKTESHGEKILFSSFAANDYLNYTIQFENTGTSNAVNVKVTDVLDAKLDETSIRMISASSANVAKRVGNNITWNFDGIELPPSVANTQIGHGYINFKIKPKPGFALGDIIFNKANIYFDFNPAIITNDCKTEFVATLKSDDFAFNDFKFYPNPIKNTLSFTNNSVIDSVTITSILGQNVSNVNVNDFQSIIDLSFLPSGVYIADFLSNGTPKKVKLVKE